MHSTSPSRPATDWTALRREIDAWARELGFAAVGVCDADVAAAADRYREWLGRGFHGEMDYMVRHAELRAAPERLVPGTVRVIVLRMDYLPEPGPAWRAAGWQTLAEPRRAGISSYAHGRDYHKVVRRRLAALCERIAQALGPFGHRAFTDSAPVLEVELARKAGLGWRGKHTLLLSRDAGSAFFLGEIFVDVPLPTDEEVSAHCGRCEACIDVCPTRAIVAPYQLDARRCISYLTIELKGAIPEALRPLIGNRVYGCDDCQLVCPWNKFAKASALSDFAVRGLERLTLLEAFDWDEPTFLARTEGMAIRRIGHERWLRNVAVGLGNALRGPIGEREQESIRTALRRRLADVSPLVAEHVRWALASSE